MIINAERIRRDVVVVAASAGGFKLVLTLAAKLPSTLPAGVAIVLHRTAVDGVLQSVVQQRSSLPVVEPLDGEPFRHGAVFLAPSDRHLVLRSGAFFRDPGPKEHFTRPAADPLFRSAASEYGPRVLGIVLSGNDSDGADGSRAISEAGGITLVQLPEEADNPAMPRNTLLRDHVSAALPVEAIFEAIVPLAEGRAITV